MTVNVTNAVGANNTIVLDGSSKIPAFDGSLVTALDADVFTTGTLATARIDVGTTAGKILQLDGSARLPALSATNLINKPGPTVSTSDPAIDTNSTLGAKWINKTSGEVYILTDATTDENVWTNVGAGTGDIIPYYYQGSTYGYTHGGEGVPTSTDYDIIDKFSFTSDANATDVGNLTVVMDSVAGTSSTTHGYAANDVAICKYSFTTDGNATDVGDLNTNRNSTTGVSSQTNGYHCGGWDFPNSEVSNRKDRYSFTTDGNATDVGDLSITRLQTGGHTDTIYGYVTCGANNVTYYNVIDRWQFASEGNSVDVGDMTVAEHRLGGSSSLTHGYCTGGSGMDVIDKFAFGSSATGSDVGNLPTTSGGMGLSGHSSTTHGYATSVGGLNTNQICKYSFTTDGNSTDVGDLTQARSYVGGTHV